MAQERRIQRVNEVIKEELNKIFLRDLSFGEGVMVTITDVKASANLIMVAVKISVLPEGKSKEVLNYLNQNIFDIQQVLNKKLNMRPVPKISFKLDLSSAKAQKIEELIERIKHDTNDNI